MRVRVHRTKVDWAIEVAQIIQERYGQEEQIQLVCWLFALLVI